MRTYVLAGAGLSLVACRDVSVASGASTNSATSAPVSRSSEFDSYMVMTVPCELASVPVDASPGPTRGHSIDPEKDQRADDRADDPGRLERALVEVLAEKRPADETADK